MTEYKILKDYPKYKIYSNGQVWSQFKQGWMQPALNTYFFVTLVNWEGKSKKEMIHRLVAKAFLPNPDNLPVVHHKDENKLNNDVSNLEWTTYSQNSLYSSHNGHTKALIMCDKKTHQEIKRFESRKEALQFLGCPYEGGHFTKVFKGQRKSYKGYWWKPAD